MSAEVRQMFSSIAPRYDVTNSVLSMGIHHLWRRKAIRLSGAAPGQAVLDCATGTGDLAIAFKKQVGAQGSVTGTDFCAEMLVPGPAKASAAGVEVKFEVADAMALPYPERTFDVSSISFGIRNVDDPVKCLQEMARVVKPGGRVVVLEFGQPRGVFGAFFKFYSRVVMPAVGGLLTGNRAAYEYLPRTAASFPAGDRFVDLMKQAGPFSEMTAHPLTSGMAYIYVGVVR